MKKVGLLGGTFDPPHLGHLIIAEEVHRSLELDEVWLIPSHVPPHKSGPLADGKARLEMTERAVADNSHLAVSDIELEREGKSYTVHTIRQLKENYPDAKFFFIIGGDMVQYLPKWHAIDRLLEMIEFVGVKRTGYLLESPYPIHEVEVPAIEVSSSMLRERLKNGMGTKYLLPDRVLEYIKEHGLYD
ncbi:nicotinate-nucleotide adenylyltransferase [Thalassobacillus pellis]|uniref:nicotinate-nucleotide adenylyltransferase n=1 Tax=Thalassobacillus pellis TaxID=748008 RepID=UPI00195FE5DA|nr:nicotinate-nucleotide adenylyltransferase [Thalassobacillus pellis]MBM7554695.1 nicotinate-nucleotide adenylyltransferase [Thalassobacillus pellis]